MSDKQKITEVDLGKAALIVVDMQNAFCHEEGALGKARLDISFMKNVIPNVARIVDEVRRYGTPVVYTQHVFRKDYTDIGSIAGIFPFLMERQALIEGSWDAQIVDELEPHDEDFVVHKRRFGAFYHSDLETTLRCLGVKTLIVVGVATNVCVESTVREAQSRDFRVIVLSDCTAASNKEFHEASLKNIGFAFASVISSAEFMSLLNDQKVRK